MSNLIGITGVAGSGKDTVAKALLYLAASKKYSNSLKPFEECSFKEAAFSNLDWEVKRFADPLKNFVAEVLGVTREQLEDRGGIVIRVNRVVPTTTSHASEAGVSNEYVDYELDNSGTIDWLINQVKQLNLI